MITPEEFDILPPSDQEVALREMRTRVGLETFWSKTPVGQEECWRMRMAVPVPEDDYFRGLLERFKKYVETRSGSMDYYETGPVSEMPSYRTMWLFALRRCCACGQSMAYYHSDKYVTYGCHLSEYAEGHDFHSIFRYDHP